MPGGDVHHQDSNFHHRVIEPELKLTFAFRTLAKKTRQFHAISRFNLILMSMLDFQMPRLGDGAVSRSLDLTDAGINWNQLRP